MKNSLYKVLLLLALVGSALGEDLHKKFLEEYKSPLKEAKEEHEKGNPLGTFHYANALYFGIDIEIDTKKATQLYLEAAEKGDISSQIIVAKHYTRNQEKERGLFTALEWYQKAKGKLETLAPESPLYVHADFRRTVQTEAQLALSDVKQKIGEVKYKIGLNYHRTVRDLDELSTYFWTFTAKAKEAYKLDQFKNQEEVLKEAIGWYRLAHKDGNRDATAMLGNLYRRGEGVEKDIEKAIEYFNQSSRTHLSMKAWQTCI